MPGGPFLSKATLSGTINSEHIYFGGRHIAIVNGTTPSYLFPDHLGGEHVVTNASVVNAPADFEIKNYSSEIGNLIWKGISVSRSIDVVSRAARVISAKSVLSLTWQNIVTGKRLTKR